MKYSDPEILRQALEARYMPEPLSGCWLWTGMIGFGGYGKFQLSKGKVRRAHRVVYECYTGEKIAEGLTLDHLCRVRSCVNPRHLEPVTGKENTLRGQSFSAINKRKTICIHGHPLDGPRVEIMVRKDGVRRRCRLCDAIYKKKYYWAKKNATQQGGSQ